LFRDMAAHGPERVRFYTRLKTMTAAGPPVSASAPNV
jgi:hypothetical protein